MNRSTRQIIGMMATFIFCVSFLYAGGTTITILHVNDTHSHLDAFGPKDFCLNGTLGGIAKAATVIGNVRAVEKNVLLLHAGDFFHGDFFFNKYFGVPELQILKQLGVDAMAVGNHEFDFGPDVFTGSLTTAFPTPENAIPFVSANIDLSEYPALAPWISSSFMKTIDGVKVGIFGMTVPGDPTTQPAPVIIRDDIGVVAQNAINNLKENGAQVVICLSHLGIALDKVLASSVSGIDFIVGGHDHLLLAEPVPVENAGGRTLIVQAGDFYRYVGKLTFRVENGTTSYRGYALLPVNGRTPKDPAVQNVVDQLKKEIVGSYGDVYHNIVGIAVHPLTREFDEKRPERDTPLGNLITDACRKKGNTDVAIAAFGFISEKIYAGAIVGADVFRAVSYGFDQTTGTGLGFRLVRLRMTGMNLITGLEGTLSFLGVSDDFFLQVSGMKFMYDANRNPGERVLLESVRIGGKKIDPAATYSVTVNEGIAYLLPLLGVEIAGPPDLMNDFEYSVVKDYIRRLFFVCYRPEGRIADISAKRDNVGLLDDKVPSLERDLGTSQDVVREFELSQNFPNPFNPCTTISYALPKDSHVRLTIFNNLGQEIAKLVDQEIPAGRHQVLWDARNVASGVYIYRIEAGGFVSAKRLVVLK